MWDGALVLALGEMDVSRVVLPDGRRKPYQRRRRLGRISASCGADQPPERMVGGKGEGTRSATYRVDVHQTHIIKSVGGWRIEVEKNIKRARVSQSHVSIHKQIL